MLTANAPDPDRVFDPIDGAEDDGGNYNLGYWLAEQFNTFYGPEFDVGDREYSPEEIEEIQELFRKIREGELVDLSEIQEDFPDFYEYLSEQPGFEQYFEGDDSQLIQGISTWGNIVDALLEAGYDQEFIDELIYDPENGVLFDRTNQNAVTLENILENLTGNDWDVLQLPTEGDNGTFRADMDGDGVYDTVVRCTSGAGSACAIEDYQVVYGAEVDMTDPEVQDQIRNAAIYEESQGTEGWEDLEDWEKNQILKDGGYTGPFVFGDGSTMPPDEPDEEQDSSVIEQIQENFPTFEDLWEKIYEQLPDLSDPEQVAEVISTILDVTGTYSVEDISTILAGGYGVIWDPATGVWTDPGSGNVFVPGLPVGLPPSSTIIGTIEDLVTDPIGTITDKIESVLGDIVSDPGGFIEGILTGALEVPVDIWDMILGGVAIGQDLYDWLIENGVETVEETTPEPPLGGEEEEPEPAVPEEAESFDRTEQVADLLGDMTSIFGDTIPDAESEPEDVRDEQIQESVLDLLGGARGGVDSDMSQEDPLAGAEDGFTFGGESSVPQDELTEEEKQEAIAYLTGQLEEKVGDSENGFTFGGESFVPQDKLTEEEKQEAIAYLTDQLEEKVGDPDDVVSDLTSETVLDDPATKPEEVLSGEDSSTGGGGGGSGGVSTQSEDFLRGLSYTPLQIAPIPARPLVDYTAGLFTQPTSRISGLQLGGITAGLFGDMIG